MLAQLSDQVLVLVPDLRRDVEQVVQNALIVVHLNDYREDVLYDGG